MSDGGRVFLRGITSHKYGLDETRAQQLVAERVRGDDVVADDGTVGHYGASEHSRTWWRVGPGDEPFLTQSLQVHFVSIEPGHSNAGHGHQNEAVFYILQGHGYEVHDGERYEWEQGDIVLVHNDSVHRHYNASEDETAVALVMKAKSLWMYLGLIQQGKPGPITDEGDFGPREDWSQLWTPGLVGRRKILKPGDASWQLTPHGKVRLRSAPELDDVRCNSVDIYEQEIPAGSRSGRHWHMADEVLYVLSGSGHSLHWEVRAELDDKYYARIANEPTRHEIGPGDTLYVPTNTVHQHVNTSQDEPLVLLSAQNRVFKLIGYGGVVDLEPAPEWEAEQARAAAPTG